MGYISAMGLSYLTDYPLVVHLDHAHSVIDSRNQNLEDRTKKAKSQHVEPESQH